jgi:hypothetical protein
VCLLRGTSWIFKCNVLQVKFSLPIVNKYRCLNITALLITDSFYINRTYRDYWRIYTTVRHLFLVKSRKILSPASNLWIVAAMSVIISSKGTVRQSCLHFQSPVVTVCTICCKIRELHFAQTLYRGLIICTNKCTKTVFSLFSLLLQCPNTHFGNYFAIIRGYFKWVFT